MSAFSVDLVDVASESSRNAVSDFRGVKTRGIEHQFEVVDRNFPSRNRWQFAVFIPGSWRKGTYASVRPLTVPNRRCWAGLERRSVQPALCTRMPHRGKCYAVFAVSDPTGEKGREILRKGDALPRWASSFRVRAKGHVTVTRANDDQHLTAIFDKSDLRGMIRFYIAARAWTLAEGFDRDDATIARRAEKDRRLRARRKLKGLTIALTGFFGMGTRQDVRYVLRKNGAILRDKPSPKTDLLVEGFHPLGASRLKIKAAETLGVPRMTEARFRRRFAL